MVGMWALCLRSGERNSFSSTTFQTSRGSPGSHTPASERRGFLSQVPALALKSGMSLTRAGQVLSWWSSWFSASILLTGCYPLECWVVPTRFLHTCLTSIWEIYVWVWAHYDPVQALSNVCKLRLITWAATYTYYLCVCVCVCVCTCTLASTHAESLSHLWLFVTPWTVACQAPLSIGFSSKITGVGCHFLLRGSSQPRDWTRISCIGRQILYRWATEEAYKLLSEWSHSVVSDSLWPHGL